MQNPRRLYVFALSSLLCACQLSVGSVPPEGSDELGGGADTPEADSVVSAEKSSEDEHERAAKVHELEMARLELRVTQMGAEDGLRSAQEKIERAEWALQDSQEELAVFRGREAPLAVKREQLDVDRARGRMQDSRAELEELEAMYAEEEFAKSTKELVLRRGRRSLEHAERSLAMAEESQALQAEVEHVQRARELERAVSRATSGLHEARRGFERQELETKVKLSRAHFELAELERELAELGDSDAGEEG